MKHYVIGFLLSCITFFSLRTEVYLWPLNNPQTTILYEQLRKSNINCQTTDRLEKSDSKNLYIVCDLANIAIENLPPYYIAYQTVNLNQNKLTPEYVQKLTNAIAIWEPNHNNLITLAQHMNHYLYLPDNYQHTDPVILPCFLPISALDSYKELLCYSNQKNTDISSHLPAIFCHAILINPEVIIEAGVRGGESTKALHKAAQLCKSHLIGIDIDPAWVTPTYNAMANALCLAMNDLDFVPYYYTSPYKDKNIDLVFIDTSHEYQHTLQEISMFVPLMSEHGALIFHDSNVTPLEGSSYIRLNETRDSAPGNPRGVSQALKEYFALDFNEYIYCNITFTRNETTWHMIHYPFCNGLTVIKKISNS